MRLVDGKERDVDVGDELQKAGGHHPFRRDVEQIEPTPAQRGTDRGGVVRVQRRIQRRGPHPLLAQRFDLPENVEVIDGGTAGMELLGPLTNLDLLVVLDAVKRGQPAGSIVKLAHGEVPVFFRSKLSPHQISICDVLASLEFSGAPPRDIVLIGVEPQSLELGLELTPAVASRVPDMVNIAVAELAARGVKLKEKAPCA
jgi:hydrogenase maturation protease